MDLHGSGIEKGQDPGSSRPALGADGTKETEGMTEEELAQLVTVDSLIGAGEPLNPSRQDAKGDEVQPTPRARGE